jgi:hypothetical protein
MNSKERIVFGFTAWCNYILTNVFCVLYLSVKPLNGVGENRCTVQKLLENVDVLTTGS